MGMDVGGKKSVKSDINVVPLIDIVLVLLVIFMVITPLLQRGIDVNIPEKTAAPTAPPPPEKKPIVLTIRQDSSIDINSEPVARYQLAEKVKEIFDKKPDKKDKLIFIKADGALVYGTVVEVMDICRGAGVDTIGLVTEGKKY